MKRPWVQHGMIRWPGMLCYDMLVLKRTGTKLDISKWVGARHQTVVEQDWDLDWLWVAPRWIGWLYRLLPNHLNANVTAWKTEPSHFLVNLAAPSWRIGLLMSGRERRFPVPAIVVDLGRDMKHHYYLPWGNNLYARLVMPNMFR